MNRNRIKGKIGGAILVFSLLFGIGIALSATAQAQNPDDRYGRDRDRNNGDQSRRGRNWDNYGNYGGSAELRQTALNAGYNEGAREGSRDRQKSRRTDFRAQSTYQRASKDYNSRLGDVELYRRYFREAFASGYNGEPTEQNRDGSDNGKQNRRGRNWDGYGNFGGSFQLRQTALNAGYNEGIKRGHNDRNKRNANRYQDQSSYQKATKDYSSRLGDRELYRRYYREAYTTGYSDGVNGF